MSTTLRGSNLINLCTPSIGYDIQVQSACTSFDPQMWEIIDDTGQVVMIPNIMGLTDSNLVDILAWQFHVDFYDATKDLEFRKFLVQQSIIWHKTKGTVQLVQDVIDAYFPGAAWLQEWFTYCNPLPPNFPTLGADELLATFRPEEVEITLNLFNVVAAALCNGEKIYFKLGATGNTLPPPIVAGTTYYVINWTPTVFQISATLGGPPLDLTGAGTGQQNEIWAKSTAGAGSWHDRYRFRVMMNENVVDPNVEQQVLMLINNYKPISRWPLDVVRPKSSFAYCYAAAVAKIWFTKRSTAATIR